MLNEVSKSYGWYVTMGDSSSDSDSRKAIALVGPGPRGVCGQTDTQTQNPLLVSVLILQIQWTLVKKYYIARNTFNVYGG